MRQKLPPDAPGPLYVAAAGHLEVQPGDEFDAPSLVPGCVSLEPAPAPDEPQADVTPSGAEQPQENPAEPPAGDGPAPAPEPAQGAGEDQPPSEAAEDQPRPKTRSRIKEPKS